MNVLVARARQNVGLADRLLGAAAASAWLGTTWPRGGWWVRTSLPASAYLIGRALSGRCWIYAMLGLNTAGAADEALELHRFITVHRPLHRVHAFVSDANNLPLFLTHLDEVVPLGEDGFRCRVVVGGERPAVTMTLVEETRNTRIVWASTPDSALRCRMSVLLTRAPGGRGTELCLDLKYSTKAGRRALDLAPLLRRLAAWQLAEEMRRLKQLLECGEVATAATRRQQTFAEPRQQSQAHPEPRL